MNGSFLEEFGGIMKKLFVNEGAMERGNARAIQNEYRKSGEAVMNSVDGDIGKAKSVLRTVKNDVKGLNNDNPLESAKIEGYARREAATGKYGNITKEEMKDIVSSSDARIGRDTTWEATKGYFTDPMRNLKSKDAATRHMAVGQLAARSAAVTGGAVATGSIINDMFSSDENDIGFGAGVGNTIGSAAIVGGGSAAAAGISMLKKL